MFEVDLSTIDLDLGLMPWFWLEMLPSVVPLVVDHDPEFISRFQIKMTRKISWP